MTCVDLWREQRSSIMRDRLLQINALRQSARAVLSQRGLTEVVTPLSTLMPGGETHLEAVPVTLENRSGTRRRLYLRTSPEVWHKKLLAQGSGPIFELAPCLRNMEGGPWHDLEFEMLEWYRPGGTFEDLIGDVEALVAAAYRLTKRPPPTLHRCAVSELFERFVGCELDPECSASEFRSSLGEQGIACAEDDTWDDTFFRAWVSKVEPQLRGQGLVVVERYPASQATMAKLCPNDPRFCLRFEVYLEGLELANAFDELTDGAEQRARFEAWQTERQRLGKEPFPADDAFFEAVAQLPPTVGIALGLDRLMARAMGSTSLSATRPFKLDALLEHR